MPPLYDLETLQLRSSWKPDETPIEMSKKYVHFASEISIHKIKNIEEEYKLSYWMNKDDYAAIRENCMRDVRLAIQQCATASPDFRGLEHRTPQGLIKRFQNRARAIKAVLDEQKHQKESGFADPEWIATVYKQVCQRSVMEAKIMGMRDEIALNHEYILSSGPNVQDLKRRTIAHYRTMAIDGQNVDL